MCETTNQTVYYLRRTYERRRSTLTSTAQLNKTLTHFFLSLCLFLCHSHTLGVLWVKQKVLKDSTTVLNRLQEIGKRVFFVTNNATKSRDIHLMLARDRGFNITKDQIITPTLSIVNYLRSKNFNKKVYLIGRSIAEELKEFQIHCTSPEDDTVIDKHYSNVSMDMLNLDRDVGAVLVNYEFNFHYSHIFRAANYLKDPNCLFIASCMDDRIPSGSDMVIPGISPIARAIEACSYRKIVNLGKPNAEMCRAVLNDGITQPERTLMIGDNARTDILLGKTCGFRTLLVGSGCHGLSDIKRWQNSQDANDKHLIPDAYIDQVGDLLKFIK